MLRPSPSSPAEHPIQHPARTYASRVVAPGDGRLDLDELGEVIDGARTLDAEPADDLLEGHDGATWRERLRSAGITPWLARHPRRLVVGSVALVLLFTSWTLYRLSVPPPVDPRVRADVVDASPDGSLHFADPSDGDVLTVTVAVTPSTPGDTVAVRGIEGPGVRASATSAAAPSSTVDGTATDVSVVTGCEDPRSSDASPDAYVLRVTRTDSYGRARDGTLPVPATIGEQLARGVTSICVQRLLSESVTSTGVGVHADPLRRRLRLDVGLHNGTGEDLTIFGIGSTGETVVTSNAPLALPAGSTGTVAVTATVVDCTRPHLERMSLPYPTAAAGGADMVDGIGLFAAPVDSVSGTGGEVVVPWTPEQRDEIQGALDRMCAGSPGATATVLDASVAPVTPDAFGFANREEGVALRLRVEVRTTGTRVLVTDTSALLPDTAGGGPPGLTSASAVVVRGRAVVTLDWAASCNGPSAPPEAELRVTARGTAYPAHARLDQASIARAYAAACPQLTPDDLESNGWPPAA